MKWLKLYVDIAQNPRIKLLAFEDRWHYISLLCAKAEGYLDERPELRDRMVSVHLGLTPTEIENVKDRLMDVGLIGAEWQIFNWDEKQSKDATGAARKRRQRAREKAEKEAEATTKEIRSKNIEENVTVTGQSRDSRGTKLRRTKPFVRPTIADLRAHIQEKGYTFTAEEFHAHYETNGWVVGRNKMKCWKSACVKWQLRRDEWSSEKEPDGPATDAGVIAA